MLMGITIKIQCKPNAGLTDQLIRKNITLSAKIRQIETRMFDYAMIFGKLKYNREY